MKLNVNIEYRTSWGESLELCIGGKRYPLSYAGEGVWETEIAKINLKKQTEYSYEVMREGRTVRTEWKKHLLALPEGAAPKSVSINDMWIDRPADAPFYSSAFTKAIFGRAADGQACGSETANLMFQVSAANIRPGEVLAIAASSEELGSWNTVIPFCDAAFPLWTLPLNVTCPFSYKFIIADKDTLAPIAWEDGENRWFGGVPEKGELIVEADVQPSFSGRAWKGAGTAIPVFSLRTEDDFGVGEFYDLKKMVDWAAATGQGLIMH